MSPKDLPVSTHCPQHKFAKLCLSSRLYVGARNSNSVPQVCPASALPTEPSPEPHYKFLLTHPTSPSLPRSPGSISQHFFYSLLNVVLCVQHVKQATPPLLSTSAQAKWKMKVTVTSMLTWIGFSALWANYQTHKRQTVSWARTSPSCKNLLSIMWKQTCI